MGRKGEDLCLEVEGTGELTSGVILGWFQAQTEDSGGAVDEI